MGEFHTAVVVRALHCGLLQEAQKNVITAAPPPAKALGRVLQEAQNNVITAAAAPPPPKHWEVCTKKRNRITSLQHHHQPKPLEGCSKKDKRMTSFCCLVKVGVLNCILTKESVPNNNLTW